MATITGNASEFITFSRTSNATVTDSDGKIKWAPHNLLLASEQFDNSNWLRTTIDVVANNAVAPNGTTTADKILSTSGNSGQFVQIISKPASTIQMTEGVFAKAAGFNWLQLTMFDSAGGLGVRCWFDLSTGAKGSTAPIGAGFTNVSYNIASVGSGWYYCTVTATTSANATNAVYIYPTNADSAFTNGNGTDGILVWGAHLYRSDLGGMKANTSAYPMYNPTTAKNLLGYTEAFDVSPWSNSNAGTGGTPVVTANSGLAPNGLMTADRIQFSLGGGTSTVDVTRRVQAYNTISATPYTFSMWVKSYDGNTYTMHLVGASGLTSNTVSVTNDWQRVSLTANGVGGAVNLAIGLRGGQTPTNSNTADILIWGAQLSDSASLDTYVPNNGAAPTAAAYYGPRLDYDPVTLAAKGLLVEESRANLVLYSAEFDNAWWVKTSQNSASVPTITASAGIAPSGGNTAYRAQFSRTGTTSIDRSRIDTASITVVASTDYTFSVWMKSYSGSNQTVSICPNFGTGAPVAVTVTNAWQRFSVTANTSAGTTAIVNIGLGYVTNSVTSADVLIWGAQLEAGSFATSYIPVGATTAGATRNPDVASVSTSQFPYSATEGTLVVAWQLAQLSGSPAALHLTDAAENNRIRINAYLSGLTRSTITAAGSLVDNIDTATATTGITKYAIGGTSANYAVYRNGSAGGTSTNSGFPSGCTEMRIGRDGASGNFNGHIRQITYLPRRISNAELITRTS